jgi:ABC-type uncharacterized transport system permease subunit
VTTHAVLDVLAQGAAIGAPLWLAALGGCLIERAGLFNLALEGTMLAGAWAGAAIGIATGSPAAAVAGAALGGAFLSALFAVCVLSWRLDQVVTGTALNLLALGGTAVMWRAQIQGGGRVPVFVPWSLGPVALQPLAWSGLLLAPLLAFALFHTRAGLHLRACGEGPAAARAAGIAVARVQTVALLLGGALVGAAGSLLLADASTFGEEMTAGRGFVALVLVSFGRRRPLRVLLVGWLFGCAMALQYTLQTAGFAVSEEARRLLPATFRALPYVLSLLVLALPGRAAAQPGRAAEPD